MGAFVYRNGRWHSLVGKGVRSGGAWHTPGASDSIRMGGKWHSLGGSQLDTEDPDPSLDSIKFDPPPQPEGTAYCITPDGSGAMDGTSWDNAYPASMIHVALLQAAPGDFLCLSEGSYTVSRVAVIPSGVSVYGGFTSSSPSWETRDGFAHPSLLVSDGAQPCITLSASAADGQCIDGLSLPAESLKGSSDTVTATFKELTFRNCLIYGSGTGAPQVPDMHTVDHCRVRNVQVKVSGSCKSCGFLGCVSDLRNASGCKLWGKGTTATLSGSSSGVTVRGTAEDPAECRFTGNSISGCAAVHCTWSRSQDVASTSSVLFDCTESSGGITSCTCVNCTGYYCLYQSEGGLAGCLAVNCGSLVRTGSIYKAERRVGLAASCCTALNCGCSSAVFSLVGKAVSCAAVSCSSAGSIYSANGNNGIVNCTAANCTGSRIYSSSDSKFTNCVSWNNTAENGEYSAYTGKNALVNCAGSVYDARYLLTLGTDNTITRFTDTGYGVPGRQDMGDCPYTEGTSADFMEWTGAFGDFRPTVGSFLAGKGVQDADVTKDAAGAPRPENPCLGAYEPVTSK